jgi:hypothetical protein
MLITRIPPSVAELVHRALADTAFLSQIAGAPPHLVVTYAEISASLAAEQWEAERRALIAATLPLELIADVAQALIAHPDTLRVQRETALYAALERVEAMVGVVAGLAALMKGEMPVPSAERQMDNVEGDLDRVRVALNRAMEELLHEIDAVEEAKSEAIRVECDRLDALWDAV